MRVLVTGAAGFLGSHLVDKFLALGDDVLGMDNHITGNPANLAHVTAHASFRFANQDVTRYIEVEGPLDGVLHFASPASPVDYLELPIQTLKVGALGTHKALGLAKAKGARFLLASTSEVYGDPLVHPQPESYWGNVNPVGPRGVYDEAKRFAEAITMAYHRYHDLDNRIVRIFNTYGPRMRPHDGRVVSNFIVQALRGEPLTVYGDGSQTRSFCYVDDLVEGIVRLFERGGAEPTNIGNPNGLRRAGGFRFVEADIVRDVLPLDGVSVVLHLAARPGVRPSLEDPASYGDTNVTGTVRVLEAARRAGLRRIVFGSSSSVYGDATPAPFAEDTAAVWPISPYAASKRAGELMAHAFAHLYGMQIACLRFFTVYGPRQRPDLAIHRFTSLIAQGQPVRMHGDGSSERDYTYITDCVAGVLSAVEWTGRPRAGGRAEPLNIGGGARVRRDRLIELIGRTLGRSVRIERHADQPGDVRLTAADLRC